MDRKKLKGALVVLDAVKNRFPKTKEFIDDTLKDKCEKKSHYRWGIFLQVYKQRVSLEKHFCFRFVL